MLTDSIDSGGIAIRKSTRYSDCMLTPAPHAEKILIVDARSPDLTDGVKNMADVFARYCGPLEAAPATGRKGVASSVRRGDATS